MLQGHDLIRFYERQFGPFVHMGAADKAIWVRYLMQGGAAYAPFSYDLRVGHGVEAPRGTGIIGTKAAYALTTKRIDVVCYRGNTVRIIEVKQRAGLSAIGQLIGYRDLYNQQNSDGYAVELMLVTDELQPDMQSILEQQTIAWYEVGY